MKCVTEVEGVTFIDLERLWQGVVGIPQADRLRVLLREAGVRFWDEGDLLVRESSIGVVGVGGLPISILNDERGVGFAAMGGAPFNITQLREAILNMMGACAFMTYLNPRDKSQRAMTNDVFAKEHFSIAHSVFLNVGIFGLSCAVENELNSQRDLVHLARVTIARTAAQRDPPLFVLDETDLPHYVRVRSLVREIVEESKTRNFESLNNLFPAAKAGMVIASGSLRNYQKLLVAKEDPGKEEEYRRILGKLHRLLRELVPSMFTPDPSSATGCRLSES